VRPSNDLLGDLVHAALDRLREAGFADVAVLVIVANQEGDACVVSSGSNLDARSTRIALLESELKRERPE
jgi:hypothetical protein